MLVFPYGCPYNSSLPLWGGRGKVFGSTDFNKRVINSLDSSSRYNK